MRYFDKDAKEITAADWEAKIRDQKYVRIDRHSFGKTSLETSWLGIQTAFDEWPSMFMSIARRDAGKDEMSDVMVIFYDSRTSLAKAHVKHQELCMELGIPLGPERKAAR